MRDHHCWPATASIRKINRYTLKILQQLSAACADCAVIKFGTSADVVDLIRTANSSLLSEVAETYSHPFVSIRDYEEQLHQAAFAVTPPNPEWSAALKKLAPDIWRLNTLVLHTIRELSRDDLLATSTIFGSPIEAVSRVGDLEHDDIFRLCDKLNHPIIKLRENVTTWKRLLRSVECKNPSVELIGYHSLAKGMSEIGHPVLSS